MHFAFSFCINFFPLFEALGNSKIFVFCHFFTMLKKSELVWGKVIWFDALNVLKFIWKYLVSLRPNFGFSCTLKFLTITVYHHTGEKTQGNVWWKNQTIFPSLLNINHRNLFFQSSLTATRITNNYKIKWMNLVLCWIWLQVNLCKLRVGHQTNLPYHRKNTPNLLKILWPPVWNWQVKLRWDNL